MSMSCPRCKDGVLMYTDTQKVARCGYCRLELTRSEFMKELAKATSEEEKEDD